LLAVAPARQNIANFGSGSIENIREVEDFLQQLTNDLTIIGASFNKQKAVFHLNDGRDIACPLAWFPRLANATPRQLEGYEIGVGAKSIHWPILDEDLSLRRLFTYSPRARAQSWA
jgi:Protein of unknown function (DUF2442)